MGKAVNFESLVLRLGEVFKPATPIDNEELFHGSIAEIRAVTDAINQSGQHTILYGERGVGKTSLAQILATKLSTGSQNGRRCHALRVFGSLQGPSSLHPLTQPPFVLMKGLAEELIDKADLQLDRAAN